MSMLETCFLYFFPTYPLTEPSIENNLECIVYKDERPFKSRTKFTQNSDNSYNWKFTNDQGIICIYFTWNCDIFVSSIIPDLKRRPVPHVVGSPDLDNVDVAQTEGEGRDHALHHDEAVRPPVPLLPRPLVPLEGFYQFLHYLDWIWWGKWFFIPIPPQL